MSDYDTLRHFADSWGLVLMGVLFVTFIGWTFLPASRDRAERARMSILNDEDGIDD